MSRAEDLLNEALNGKPGAGRGEDEPLSVVSFPAEPTPLQAPRVPAQFPVDALPSWASEYVAALSTATQTPADLAGCCVLGVLSAAAGGRVMIQPRRGWREPVNLYCLPVLPPGSRKSAVVSETTRPLYDAERDLEEKARAERGEQAILRDIATKAAEKASRDAANAGSAEQRLQLTADAVSAAEAAENIEVPPAPRLIADDVTPEAVASLLAEHRGRLAIISAEGGVFDMMAGRYSKVPSLDVWLKGHAGDPVRVDRKGRPAEYVEHPALTLLLTVQPSVLASIARNGEFRGRGLLARFLYSIPPDNVGYRMVGLEPVSEPVADSYVGNVRKMVDDLAAWTDPAVLTFSEAAQTLLLEFERAVEPKLRRDGDYGGVREWASKLVGAAVRLAGLLHLAEGGEWLRTPISESTLAAAIRLADYFAEHAQAAFGLLGDTGTSDAAYLLDYIGRKGIEQFTIRSLHVELPRGRFATAEDVTAAVEILAEHGWAALLPPPERKGPGRKPSPTYAVHPMATESTQSTDRRQPPDSVDSVDSVVTSTHPRRAS